MQTLLEWCNGDSDHRPVLQGRACASLVRGHSPVRRRQRPHRARNRGHGSRPDRSGARGGSTACRRRSVTSAENTTTSSNKLREARWTSRPGWNGSLVASLAPSRRTGGALQTSRSGATGEKLRDVLAEPSRAAGDQQAARGLRGQADDVKAGSASGRRARNDSALRDIQQLVDRGVLVRNPAGGRSTSYSLGRMS